MESLTKREQPDRSKINVHQPDELKGWTRALNVTREELLAAVDKVGDSAAAVRKELERRAARQQASKRDPPPIARERHAIKRRFCRMVQ